MRYVGGLLLVLAAGAAGCTKPNAAASCPDGTCIDPAFPFCDLDGAVSGEPNKCIAVSCTPGDFAGCRGDIALTCNADGSNYNVNVCQTGCSVAEGGCNACVANTSACGDHMVEHCGPDGTESTPEVCQTDCVDAPIPHCGYLQPKYLPDVCDALAMMQSLAITTSETFDTTVNTNCTGGIIPQASGPPLCVVRYAAVSISPGVTLSVHGANALAIVADGSLSIDGTLDLGAQNVTSGPGGGFVVSGNPTTGFDSTAQGGGGAGFRTTGGRGGGPTADGLGALGGVAALDPATLSVLLGGPKNNDNGSMLGGGGGGAATLISCRGIVSITGTVTSGGGGGLGGIHIFGAATGGFGGGAGGYVVLQGVKIAVTGEAYANGGGGGAGTVSQTTVVGFVGADGSRSDTTGGAGGTSLNGPDGDGGNGGCIIHTPQNGAKPREANGTAGGGGGSTGFLQTYTPAGVTPTLTPAHASPAFQPNGTVPTR